MEKIAIVILNYVTWQETLKELNIVHEVMGIPYKDVIIVDNHSPNESYLELKKSIKLGFSLLLADENGGYASGNNIGLRYARKHGYKYAWILNNDIIINDTDLLTKLMAIFAKDDSVATVNSDVFAPNGHLFNRDSVRPTWWDLTFGMSSYRKRGRKLDITDGYAYIYRPQGCSMILDLDKVADVNYLDEKTFLYSEEIILAERLMKKGYRCALNPDVQVIHNHSTTVRTMVQKNKIWKIQQDSFLYYLNNYREFNKLQIWICWIFNGLKIKLLFRG